MAHNWILTSDNMYKSDLVSEKKEERQKHKRTLAFV